MENIGDLFANVFEEDNKPKPVTSSTINLNSVGEWIENNPESTLFSELAINIVKRRLFEKENIQSIAEDFHLTKSEATKIYNSTVSEIKKLLKAEQSPAVQHQQQRTVAHTPRVYTFNYDVKDVMIKPDEQEIEAVTELLNTPVQNFEWTTRMRNNLKRGDIYFVGELIYSYEQLMKIANFGEKAIDIIEKRMNFWGVKFLIPKEQYLIDKLIESKLGEGSDKESKTVSLYRIDKRTLHQFGHYDLKEIRNWIEKNEGTTKVDSNKMRIVKKMLLEGGSVKSIAIDFHLQEQKVRNMLVNTFNSITGFLKEENPEPEYIRYWRINQTSQSENRINFDIRRVILRPDVDNINEKHYFLLGKLQSVQLAPQLLNKATNAGIVYLTDLILSRNRLKTSFNFDEDTLQLLDKQLENWGFKYLEE